MNPKFYALAFVLCLPPAARAADTAPTGVWLDGSGRGGIDIQPCGGKLCGNLTWLKAPLNEQGKPKTDIHNPDTTLQSRPLCGVPILSGFVSDGPGAWTDGMIYDAASGKTYHANMKLADDGTLHVRGYIGFSLLGRTEIWTRPASALAHCR